MLPIDMIDHILSFLDPVCHAFAFPRVSKILLARIDKLSLNEYHTFVIEMFERDISFRTVYFKRGLMAAEYSIESLNFARNFRALKIIAKRFNEPLHHIVFRKFIREQNPECFAALADCIKITPELKYRCIREIKSNDKLLEWIFKTWSFNEIKFHSLYVSDKTTSVLWVWFTMCPFRFSTYGYYCVRDCKTVEELNLLYQKLVHFDYSSKLIRDSIIKDNIDILEWIEKKVKENALCFKYSPVVQISGEYRITKSTIWATRHKITLWFIH